MYDQGAASDNGLLTIVDVPSKSSGSARVSRPDS